MNICYGAIDSVKEFNYVKEMKLILAKVDTKQEPAHKSYYNILVQVCKIRRPSLACIPVQSCLDHVFQLDPVNFCNYVWK